jgi:hypothetical protein
MSHVSGNQLHGVGFVKLNSSWPAVILSSLDHEEVRNEEQTDDNGNDKVPPMCGVLRDFACSRQVGTGR